MTHGGQHENERITVLWATNDPQGHGMFQIKCQKIKEEVMTKVIKI